MSFLDVGPDPKASPPCTKCGWYGDGDSVCRHDCDPAAGKRATLLETDPQLAGIASTRFGYGHRKLTFVFDERCHLTLGVGSSQRPFRLDKLFCLGDFTHQDVSDLVQTIAAWRKRSEMRADRAGPARRRRAPRRRKGG